VRLNDGAFQPRAAARERSDWMRRMGAVNSNLFEPMSLGSLRLSNRIVMAPMSRLAHEVSQAFETGKIDGRSAPE
jgi:hypothetical protein